MKFSTPAFMLAMFLQMLSGGNSLMASETSFEPESAPTGRGPVRLRIEGHPRLLWSADDIPRLRAKAADRTVTEQGTSTAVLWQQVVEKAQGTKADILTMALVHAIAGDDEWIGKIREKMLQICAKENWGAHFELADASLDVAVGLDAIYGRLSEKDRILIRRALAEKGVQPLLKAVADRPWTL